MLRVPFAKLAVTSAMLCALAAPAVHAGAVHDASKFTDNTLAGNDDGSTGLVAMGFNIDFYGQSFSNLYVNNNGNVTFDAPLGTFTPFNLLTTGRKIIAPFFGDVDTRTGERVQYGQDTISGRNVFGVNWFEGPNDNGVGYFSQHLNKLNKFQLILTDRSDIRSGDFDIEFNYDQIQWETGDASGGSNGVGGNSARAGWSNGSTSAFELLGSAINGAFLNGGPNALISGSLNSQQVAGRYIFQVRNGAVVTVPEPTSIALLGLALAGLGAARRRKV